MFLFEWIAEVFRELARVYQDNWGFGGPAGRMQRQLRVMFGRGEIDQMTFLRLRDSLDKGYYIEGELHTLHRQGALRLQMEGRYIDHHFDAQVARALENLYINRAMLAEARHAMTQALATIQAQRAWMDRQAEGIRQNAQQALPDEAAARGFLEIRYDLLEQQRLLESRAALVQHNLRQMDTLEGELGVYESDLLLADSRESYASVNLAINHQRALLEHQHMLVNKPREP